ncbi:MAG: single-stranded DNA-binding protein [Christensenellaceae bacterium]|jgi:single-stranded DNA-binding protein|nr:single-stranded DNA-binding protein [Christensenellaceae bacterium]
MENRVYLLGRISSAAEFSHAIAGSAMYTCKLLVPRLSGTEDEVVLLFDGRFLPKMQGEIGLSGQLRGYSRLEEGRRRLKLMALVKSLTDQPEEDNNRVELEASLFRPPLYRQTPLGREITDLLLRVPRARGGDDIIPAIVWGGCARFAQGLQPGAPLRVTGRLQSRSYSKLLPSGEIQARTAYELSINQLSTAPRGREEPDAFPPSTMRAQ